MTFLQEEQRRHQEEIGKLTIGIRRIIEVMKQEDMLSEDVRDGYKQLVREKERLLALREKLQLELSAGRSGSWTRKPSGGASRTSRGW